MLFYIFFLSGMCISSPCILAAYRDWKNTLDFQGTGVTDVCKLPFGPGFSLGSVEEQPGLLCNKSSLQLPQI